MEGMVREVPLVVAGIVGGTKTGAEGMDGMEARGVDGIDWIPGTVGIVVIAGIDASLGGGAVGIAEGLGGRGLVLVVVVREECLVGEILGVAGMVVFDFFRGGILGGFGGVAEGLLAEELGGFAAALAVGFFGGGMLGRLGGVGAGLLAAALGFGFSRGGIWGGWVCCVVC